METVGGKTLGVLLAAGAGTRFRGPEHKLLTGLFGAPIVASAFSAMHRALPDVVVITGAVDLSGISEITPTLHNPDWKSGQRSSVIAAIKYAQENNYTAIVIGLCDQPFITPEAWTAVSSSHSPIAVATYDGYRGNPVRLDHSVWDMFLELNSDPDSGARDLIHMHPELVEEVACKGNSADIDTAEDLDSWT
jgi:CTP:molybdopterin cytidylyltransferase MocA